MTETEAMRDVERWAMHDLADGKCVRCGIRYFKVSGMRGPMALGRSVESPLCLADPAVFDVEPEACDPAAPYPTPVRALLRVEGEPVGGVVRQHHVVVAGYEDAWDGDLDSRWVT